MYVQVLLQPEADVYHGNTVVFLVGIGVSSTSWPAPAACTQGHMYENLT